MLQLNTIFIRQLILVTLLFAITATNRATGASITWVGNTTAWLTPGNWSGNAVPLIGDNVTIPTSPTGGNFPTISTGTNPLHDIIIQAGATVSQTGGTLQVNHDWRNSGTYTASAGTIQFIGNAAGATFFDVGTNQFYDVIVDAGVQPQFDAIVGSSVLIAHDYTNNNTGLDENNKCTFTFNGTGTQNIYSASTAGKQSFGNLVINKSAGTATLTSNIEITANLTITTGTFSTGSNYSIIVAGNAAFNGGSFTMNTSTITVTATCICPGSSYCNRTCIHSEASAIKCYITRNNN